MFDNILLQNKLDIMTESAALENYSTNNAVEELTESDLRVTLDLIESFDEDVKYTLEAIPVIVKEGAENMYIVEYDMLHKVIESFNVDEAEAMKLLAEENNIPMSHFYLMIESDEYFINEMREAGSKGGSQLKGKVIDNATKSIDDLKAKGIKLVKKPNKKKNKKKAKKSKSKGKK